MPCDAYGLEAKWGQRAATAADLADRFTRTVDAMRALNPGLDQWRWGDAEDIWETEGQTEGQPFATVRANLVTAIERNVSKGSDSIADSRRGYLMMVLRPLASSESTASLTVSAGDSLPGSEFSAFKNYAAFRIGVQHDTNLITFVFWHAMMVVIGEIWEATWAEVAPDDSGPLWLGIPVRSVWMSYVSPRFAPLITPPSGAIVEHRPNGGLFLAATDETFQTANPAHMAAAREIEAALQPLNKLAWPIDDPYT